MRIAVTWLVIVWLVSCGNAVEFVPVPIRTTAQPLPGGEGCQWPRGAPVFAPTNADMALLPIDVGGLYRTVDGGKSWRLSVAGWNARGANGFAIDPRNDQHVVDIGGNSMNWNPQWGDSPHGLYLSLDGASSWTQAMAWTWGEIGPVVAFDPSSFDSRRGEYQRVYVARPEYGVSRSDDGGQTWQLINPDRSLVALAFGQPLSLSVDPTGGAIYLGSAGGLMVSHDAGESFAVVFDRPITGMSLVPKATPRIVVSGDFGLAGGDGQTFSTIAATGIGRSWDGKSYLVCGVTRSPVDARRVGCWVEGPHYRWPRFVSNDGGNSLVESIVHRDEAFMPLNARQGYMAWSPVESQKVLAIGGDWVTAGHDGGQNFHYSSHGFNAVMAGGMLAFGSKPGVLAIGFQDYNGAVTDDDGQTWRYLSVSGHGWGGHA